MSNWFHQIYDENTGLIKISNLNYEASVSGKKTRIVIRMSEDFFSEGSERKFKKNIIWQIIKNTPNLMWMIVTDNIQNMDKSLPKDWHEGYTNCAILALCKSQDAVIRAMQYIPDGKSNLFGLYLEDVVEQIDFSSQPISNKLSVVVVGNDLLGSCRPHHPDWVNKMSDDCANAMVPFFYEGFGKYSIHKIIDNGVTVPPVTTQLKEKLNEAMIWTKNNWICSLPKERIKVRKLFCPGSVLAVVRDEKDVSGMVNGMVKRELPLAML